MTDMTHKTVPVEPTALLAAFDKAVADELPRVSHVEYDSHEICKHFASKVRARIAFETPSPVTELEAMLYEALRAFRDGGPEGGADFNGWHQSYEEPCRLAREALAAYEAKKEGK